MTSTGADRERWERLADLVADALDLPPGEREAFVRRETAGDAELASEALGLIDAGDDAESYFASLAGRVGAAEPEFDEPSLVGTEIGAYRVVELAGRGGMGAVYKVERTDDQFEQEAALKLLPIGLGVPEARGRFLAERQLLARLDHPGIARLLDGGVTADGTPYFIMEYVEGTPVDRFCDENALGIRERLEIFCRICDAVSYLHRNLVVHRDLKPGNILVTAEGQVKLLDFGIAKLVDPESTEFGLTIAGFTPMTPAYASPEQLAGEAVSTTSDVYSLGVLLSVLLSGRLPYRVARGDPLALAQAIRDTGPRAPSARLADPSEDPETDAPAVARARGSTVERLNKMLGGDLDAITLTALRREPDRRYFTALQLKRDVERFLNSEPVRARKDSFAYRTSRFVARHTAVVVAAGAALVLLVALLVTATVFAISRTRQADEIARQRDNAEEVVSVLGEIFELADPREGPLAELSARELVDWGSERIRAQVHAEPEVRAKLMQTIAGVYTQLGLADEAEPLLEEALAIWRDTVPEAHPSVAATLLDLGSIRLNRGEYEAAREPLDRALASQRSLFGEEAPEVVSALTANGHCARKRGDHASAEHYFQAALAILEREHGRDDPRTLNGVLDLASGYHDAGRLDDASRLWERVAQAYRGLPEQMTPRYGRALATLATYYDAKRQVVKAGEVRRQVLDLRRAIFGEVHPQVADAMHGMAIARNRVGDLRGGREYLIRAMEIFEQTDAPVGLVDVVSDLARVEYALGSYESADRYLDLTFEMAAGGLAEEKDVLAAAWLYRGLVAFRQGHEGVALAALDRAGAMYEAAFGPDHPMRADVEVQRAMIHRMSGRPEAALGSAEAALDQYHKMLRVGHPRTTRAHLEILRAMDLDSDPAAYLVKAEETYAMLPPAPTNPSLQAGVRERLARARLAAGDRAGARAVLEEVESAIGTQVDPPGREIEAARDLLASLD